MEDDIKVANGTETLVPSIGLNSLGGYQRLPLIMLSQIQKLRFHLSILLTLRYHSSISGVRPNLQYTCCVITTKRKSNWPQREVPITCSPWVLLSYIYTSPTMQKSYVPPTRKAICTLFHFESMLTGEELLRIKIKIVQR